LGRVRARISQVGVRAQGRISRTRRSQWPPIVVAGTQTAGVILQKVDGLQWPKRLAA
jgi:hypothetical protein